MAKTTRAPRKAAAPRKARKATKSSAEVYTKPRVRDRLKAEILAGDKGGAPGQWSARKSQLLAAAYKKAGGGYKKTARTEGQQDLAAWTDQDWTTADGAPARREGTTARYLPEAAWEELTPAQRRATERKKVAGSERGRQHVANTRAAKSARRRATGEG